MHRLSYILIRVIIAGLNTLPFGLRLRLVELIAKVFLLSKRREAARKNLSIALPELCPSEQNKVMIQSCKSFALMLVDTLRYVEFDKAWVEECVEIDNFELYIKNIRAKHPTLKLTAHYGSFDLSTATHASYATHGAIIVRELRNPYLSAYIRRLREQQGVKTLTRSGGLRSTLKELKSGGSVGMLFDQNLTRKNAVFVDWFGKPAATTVGPAALAWRVKCQVQIELVAPRGRNRYLLKVRDCPYKDLLDLSEEEFKLAFTERASKIMQELILEEPEHWFWFHRRWKTRPEGEPENVY